MPSSVPILVNEVPIAGDIPRPLEDTPGVLFEEERASIWKGK